MNGAVKFSRREAMLAGLSGGLAGLASPLSALAGPTRLQHAIDEAAATRRPLFLPAGIYPTGTLTLKSGTRIHGVPGETILRAAGEPIFACAGADNIHLSGLTLEGTGGALSADSALLAVSKTTNLQISDCRFLNSGAHGIWLHQSTGRIAQCEFGAIAGAALRNSMGASLEISGNHIHDCGQDGIVVSRAQAGKDGAIIQDNHIERIAARTMDSSETGNGITVLQSSSVTVARNRITDCAASAVRIDGGSGCRLIGNSCARLGAVALTVATGPDGAVIANNFIDTASSGIAVSHAAGTHPTISVRANIVRNLFFRKTGEMHGIGIRLDASGAITGNVVEGAPAYGIFIGSQAASPMARVSGNVIRKSHIGIAVMDGVATPRICDNTIDDARDGAIRALRSGSHQPKLTS